MAFMAALPAITAGAGLLGKLFSGAAKGSADQRMGENQQRLQQQQLQNSDALARAALMNNNATTRASMANTDNYNRAGLDLERKQFSQREPSVQARQALAGSLLSRIKPVQIAGMPEGMGVRSSIIDTIGPEAREAGSLLSKRGLSGLRSGPTQFDEMPAVSLPDILSLPPATQMALQKSGLLEKLLGGAGLVGSIMGGLGELGVGKPKYDPYEHAGGG